MAASSSSLASSRHGMTAASAAPIGMACGALLASYLLQHTDDVNEDGADKHAALRQQQPQQQRSFALLSHLLRPVPADCFFFQNNSSNQDLDTTPSTTNTSKIVVNTASFDSLYEIGPKLGTGAFAAVYKCTQKNNSKRPAAVKVFDLSKVPKEKQATIKKGIHEEVAILQSLKHDRIVQAYDFFDSPTDSSAYLVMEFCQGGELFERIVAKTTYNEKEARDVIRMLLSALAFCHDEAKVVHRDLKPENLLLESTTCDLQIKLADFGAASRIQKPDSLTRYCGTPSYTAPEILSRKRYGCKVDMWSAGIIAYILLGGYPPFADNQDQIKKKHTILFHSPEWDKVSPEAKSLISHLLLVDPRRRLSATEALSHKWFSKEKEELEERDLKEARDGIRKFNALRKMRAAVRVVMATNKMRSLLTPPTGKEN